MNPELLRRMVELLDRRIPFAVATVVSARGSVPGKLGARMIVLEDGTQEGTVGGAGLEERVKALATRAIQDHRSGTHHFELARQKPDGLDSVCGGGVEVFVEYMAPRPHLLICGGGHVGLALATLSDQLDYSYSIADVRPEFATAERFPGARGRHSGTPEDLLREVDLSRFSHLLVVGHEHSVDSHLVASALESGFSGYIGVIGSRNKRREFRERCQERGISSETFEKRVTCPIGLPIGAETPDEIAVAVMAEVIRGYRETTPSVPAEPAP